jgi:hypothetical protein
MGKPHAWKEGMDMELVRRLVKATRKQSGAFTTNNEGLPTDKDVVRAIKTGKAMYTEDSIIILEQIAQEADIPDYKGDTLKTTAACVLITDLAGPQSRELVARIKAHLGNMPAARRPNLYAKVWLQDTAQKELMKAAGLIHLSTWVAPNGAMIGTYGPKDQATIDHLEEDLIVCKEIHPDHITAKQQAAILKIQAKQPKRVPKSIKEVMDSIPGKAVETFGFSIQPGETTKASGQIGSRKPLASGQTVLFLVPLQVGADSATWMHSKDNTGKEVQLQLKERGLYYVDPRKPWTITNHSNQANWVMVITVKGDQEVAEFITK